MNNNPNYKGYDFLFKVVIMGDSNAGKTLLLRRYVDNQFSDQFICTIGVDFKTKIIEQDDKIYKLQIWDTAGQERFRNITAAQDLEYFRIFSYFRGAKGVLLCYSINSQQSFDRVPNYYQDIQKNFEKNNEKPAIILCGLKCDLQEERQVSPDVAQAFADAYNIPYIENSAKLNTNVDLTFELLTAEMARNRVHEVQFEQENLLNLNQNQQEQKKQKKDCC